MALGEKTSPSRFSHHREGLTLREDPPSAPLGEPTHAWMFKKLPAGRGATGWPRQGMPGGSGYSEGRGRPAAGSECTLEPWVELILPS